MKAQAHKQMTQKRRHASVLASLVAKLGTSLMVAGMSDVGVIGTKGIHAIAAICTHLVEFCASFGITAVRNESRPGMTSGFNGFNWKHRNIIRGGRPQVATG